MVLGECQQDRVIVGFVSKHSEQVFVGTRFHAPEKRVSRAQLFKRLDLTQIATSDQRRVGQLQAMKLSTFIALLAIPLWPPFVFAESPTVSFAYILQADSFAKTKAIAVE